MKKTTTAHEFYLLQEYKKDFKDWTIEGLNHLKIQVEKMFNENSNLSIKTLEDMKNKIIKNIEVISTNNVKSAKEDLLEYLEKSNKSLDRVLN